MKTLLRVLIVEDDAMIAILMAEIVTGLGHEVCAVEVTEAGAVAAALRYQPDMMIVDDKLADGTGISAVARIVSAGSVPHIFVTGDPRRVRTQRPGAVVLQKPFFERELVQAIGTALGANVAS